MAVRRSDLGGFSVSGTAVISGKWFNGLSIQLGSRRGRCCSVGWVFENEGRRNTGDYYNQQASDPSGRRTAGHNWAVTDLILMKLLLVTGFLLILTMVQPIRAPAYS